MATWKAPLQTTKLLLRSVSLSKQSRPFYHLAYKTMPRRSERMKQRSSLTLSDDRKEQRIVWIDLEMTGLDIEKDKIIEIACLVTSANLDIVAEGPNIVIHQPKDLMDTMDDWCQQHHGQSGLTKAVLDSNISIVEAEDIILSFVKSHVEMSQAPLAGNSVYMDKMFLQRYMPSLVKYLHYRIIDVSTIKELCRRWYPETFFNAPKKKVSHRALDDIKESVQELRYYRQSIFIPAGSS